MATVNNRINGNKFICNLLLFVLSIFPLFVVRLSIRSKALAKAFSFLCKIHLFSLLLLLFYITSIFFSTTIIIIIGIVIRTLKIYFRIHQAFCLYIFPIQCMHVYIMFVKFIIHHVESAFTVRSIACTLRHYDVMYG